MSLIAYVSPHTREEENSNERSAMTELAVSSEQMKKLIAQVVDRSNGAGVDEIDLRAAGRALEELAISAAMYKMWNEGEIEFGWDGDDFVVFATTLE